MLIVYIWNGSVSEDVGDWCADIRINKTLGLIATRVVDHGIVRCKKYLNGRTNARNEDGS